MIVSLMASILLLVKCDDLNRSERQKSLSEKFFKFFAI